ncbi:MAG: hypothetical protein Ta2D_11420 [Rickettsiales bacterium]|nr:MAG: hypothetical protein Ta2D_11420 [Rickettsiales bacterium]
MCGLNGIFSYQNITDIDIEKIKKMNVAMSYRGPDGNGFYNDDKCVLGHVRLSITGVSNGQQPLYTKIKLTK